MNARTKNPQSGATIRKRSVRRQAFTRNAGRHATNVTSNLNVKTKAKNFATKTKRNVTRPMLRRNAQRPVENVMAVGLF